MASASPTIENLTHAAGEIIDMAEDLQHQGLPAEALAFALAAAKYLHAVRALERLRRIGARMAEG
jgi:hypothetical protein